ncbi:MAG: hypothetical protein PHE55_08805 [Methylococcaceae bacterium]|nr:hypothetical protein [Methylococcaceae bacterium]
MTGKKFDEHPLTETEKLKLQNVGLQRALLESQARLMQTEGGKLQAQGRAVLDEIRVRLGLPAGAVLEPSDDGAMVRTPHIEAPPAEVPNA